MAGGNTGIAESAAPRGTDRSLPDELVNRCLGDLDFVERVLAAFFGQFTQDLEDLQDQFTSRNTSQIASIAHRMKGASANVGASGLHRCTAEIEHLARDERLADIALQLDRLNKEWSQFAASAGALTDPRDC